ncbi:MAG: M23 family metallopeptidase [Bacteroidetes bacterium]|nr:M23 family metallopeptidase [Bacteroidota bacterium]
MRKTSCLLLITFLFGFICVLRSQGNYPKNYFRSPVDFRIILAGSFGELRMNHIHSGIDIRTEGVQGKPVYAVADGYICRINISSTGFGKALYLMHPNGYVTVYGHLSRFNPAIGAWIRAQQYKKESFVIDTPIDPGILKVKKGEIMAYSGNSGASGGPHLHFEIRDAATENAINPMFFGFDIKDVIPPKLKRIRIYPMDENSLVNFSDKPLLLAITGSSGNYQIRMTDTVRVSGNIIFGIEADDPMNDCGSFDGASSIQLYVDTTLYFSQNNDHLVFNEMRYVNSLLDYPYLVSSRTRIERSYIAPNNKLTIYGINKNHGIVNFSDNRAHMIVYILKDASGNTSRLSFPVKSHPPVPSGRKTDKTPLGTLFSCKSENHFSRNDLHLDIPKDALYEDLDFEYSSSPCIHGTYSKVHHIHNKYTPLHTFITLAIKPEGLPANLVSKVVVAMEDTEGHFIGKGGIFENGFGTTKIRDFGDYVLKVDTIPPVIRPINISINKNISRQNSIMIKISDDLSGIKSYRGTLNGKWILMDYDAKNSLLVYSFDEMIHQGKNVFKLVVKDDTGNNSVYSATLQR